MPHIFRWVVGSLVFAIAGSIPVALLTGSLLAPLFYLPYFALLGEMIRQGRRFKHSRAWAVWTGEPYPWGTMHQVYAVKREAEQAVDKLRAQGQYAYLTESERGR